MRRDFAELAGSRVLAARKKHKLGRREFLERLGSEGKGFWFTPLANIERKDQWGKWLNTEWYDRVLALVTELESTEPPSGRRESPGPKVMPTPTARSTAVITPGTVDDDDDILWCDPTFDDDLNEADEELHLASVCVPTSGRDEEPDTSTASTTATVDDDGFRVSNSLLQTFKRCKRKWWLAWYRRLTVRHPSTVGVRSVGDQVHRALSMWYVGDEQTPVDPRVALEHIIESDWNTLFKAAQEQGYDEFRLADLAAKYTGQADLERAMIEGYVQWIAETGQDSELEIVASETALSADVELSAEPGDDVVAGNGDGGRSVKIIGLLDARVRRRTDGVRFLIDHKTVGSLTVPTPSLPRNEQMLHYMLLEFLNTPEGETRCDGALYNMLRRVKRTERAKPPFYDRVEVRHNQIELDSYKRRMLATTREILRVTAALDAGTHHLDVVPPTPTSSCDHDCDFAPICTMFDDGSRVEDAITTLYQEHDPHGRYDGRYVE